MNVVFRVDASRSIGVGHIMRCLTLAESLRNAGSEIRFICREQPGNLIALLEEKNIAVSKLPAPRSQKLNLAEDYAYWLGVTQAEDARQTCQALNGEQPDWLVADHYGLGIDWEQRLIPHVDKLLVIDDLANRHHLCDLLIDQNYFINGEQRYAKLVLDNCELLQGPKYALLRSEFSNFGKIHRDREGILENVFVFFGGTDQQNMTGMAVEALSHPKLSHLKIDVVVGVNYPYQDEVEVQLLKRGRANLHKFRPQLADLMIQADLALGAGGTTTWERMCLGLPSLVISTAENQRRGAEALAEDHLIYYLGGSSDVNVKDIYYAVTGLISNAEDLAGLSKRNRALVDGLGVSRVREVVSPTSIDKIQLRQANIDDMGIYFNWANDLDVRKHSFNPQPIMWETHEKWFMEKIDSSNSLLFVLNADELPVGQIRFDRVGNKFKIDYSLDNFVRKRGWGARLIELGMKMMEKFKPVEILAEVHVENQASQKIFTRLGYKIVAKNPDFVTFQYRYC